MIHQPTDRDPTRREALRDIGLIGGLAVAGGIVGASPLGSVPAAAATGDQLIVAVSATPVSLDPEFGASLESWELPVFIYEYLVFVRFQERRGPASASRNSMLPLSRVWRRDGTFLGRQEDHLLSLRKGVKSEYGNEFTAGDVKWSWDRTFALNTAGTWMMKSSSVPNADAIRVVEPCILEVSLSGPNALLSDEQATPLNNPVIYDFDGGKEARDGQRSLGEGMARQEQRDLWAVSRGAIHARPTSRLRGQSELLPGKAEDPEGDLARGAVIGDAAATLAGRFGTHRQGTRSARATAGEGKPGVKVTSIEGNEAVIFGLNNKVKPLDNVKVRQAIAYAAPIDAIIETVYLKDPNVRLLKG